MCGRGVRFSAGAGLLFLTGSRLPGTTDVTLLPSATGGSGFRFWYGVAVLRINPLVTLDERADDMRCGLGSALGLARVSVFAGVFPPFKRLKPSKSDMVAHIWPGCNTANTTPHWRSTTQQQLQHPLRVRVTLCFPSKPHTSIIFVPLKLKFQWYSRASRCEKCVHPSCRRKFEPLKPRQLRLEPFGGS